MTATNEMPVASTPAIPKVRISPDCEMSSAANDSNAVPCASTQAGPTTRTAKRTASALLSPSRRRMRIADTICMLSAKPITMTSGVMTLRNRLRRKPSQPKQTERPQHRQHRRQRRQQHQRNALEEDHGDGGAEQQPEAVVDELIALHRVADLELHDRRTRQVRLEADGIQLLLQVIRRFRR